MKSNPSLENNKLIISKILNCFLNWIMVMPKQSIKKVTWYSIFQVLENIYVSYDNRIYNLFYIILSLVIIIFNIYIKKNNIRLKINFLY